MNEAILIEIATRFRDLEDAIEKAQMFIPEDPNDSLKTDLGAFAEACRDDMVAIQERIRKGLK